MTIAWVLSVLFSGGLLLLLGARDPKRLRSARHERGDTAAGAAPLASGARKLSGWLVLLPGVVLAVMGLWWPFLIWFGATTAIGWAVAQTLGFGSHSAS
jgi:hypothetical protein